MEDEYKIDKTDNGYKLKKIYTKNDNTKGSIEVAQFTDIIEFNLFLEKSSEKRLNEFLKEHKLKGE